MSTLAKKAADARKKNTPKYTQQERVAARNAAMTDLHALHIEEFDELYAHYLANPKPKKKVKK